MDKYTQRALSFIDSGYVRDVIAKSGIVFSAENTIPLVFESNRPQAERFPVILDILNDLDSPQARQLSEILIRLDEITNPVGNPRYLFREKYRENPRIFLTAAQMKRWLLKNTGEVLNVKVYSHGKVICDELCLDENGICDVRCSSPVKRLLEVFKPPKLKMFQAGDVVRDITDGSMWIVINADFTSEYLNSYTDWEIFDFSAMVIPYEYREYATPQLIERHCTERKAGEADMISQLHSHAYIPFLELVTPAENR